MSYMSCRESVCVCVHVSYTCLALHSLPNDASHRFSSLSLLPATKPDGAGGGNNEVEYNDGEQRILSTLHLRIVAHCLHS